MGNFLWNSVWVSMWKEAGDREKCYNGSVTQQGGNTGLRYSDLVFHYSALQEFDTGRHSQYPGKTGSAPRMGAEASNSGCVWLDRVGKTEAVLGV